MFEPVTLEGQALTAESSPPMSIRPRQHMSKGKEEGREWPSWEDWVPKVGCIDQGGNKAAYVGVTLMKTGRHPTFEPVTPEGQAPMAESSPPMLITPHQHMS